MYTLHVYVTRIRYKCFVCVNGNLCYSVTFTDWYVDHKSALARRCYLQHRYGLMMMSVVTRRPPSADRPARRQFQATGQPVSRTQASDAMTSRCRTMRRSMCNAGATNARRSLCIQISREWSYPLPIYWYHSKGNWLHCNFAAESFYIMKLCSRVFVLYCRNCPKDDKFRYFIPILRKLGAA